MKFIKPMNKLTYILIILLSFTGGRNLHAQQNAYILDRVVAVVGDFHVLQSDIEQQILQLRMSQAYVPEEIKCDILNYFIQQKLLMSQAQIDSIEVSNGQVEISMQSRLNNIISQFGSEEAMEEYFGKSIFDIRDDLRKSMKDMMITNQVRESIVGDIKITPSEVKSFFKKLPTDSIPYIDSEVKIAQIVAYPPVDEDAEFEVKERLLNLRKRISEGESMSTLAILYSDDPSATSNFGEIGFRSKSELDPAYADAAWALKVGQISKIVKSGFGYHIIQCVERRGDRVNTRHILLKPKVDATAKGKALAKLDSIRSLLEVDSITFHIAAIMNSEDEKTRANGGLVVNPENQAATFQLDQLDTKDYYTLRDMKVGEISMPYETTDQNGKLCFKILKLTGRTEPHRATVKQDYLMLQNMALAQKKQDVMDAWFVEKKKKTYIKIDASFEMCNDESQELTTR